MKDGRSTNFLVIAGIAAALLLPLATAWAEEGTEEAKPRFTVTSNSDSAGA